VVGRILAIAGLVVATAVVAVTLLESDARTRYTLTFQTAGQLVVDDDVQVGGHRVGRVAEIRLTDDNQASIEIEVSDDFAPLHQGTTAAIRATSLSGVANRYIALHVGRNDQPELPEGATLTAEATTTPVDLDQVFDTLDAPTRRSLRRVIAGSATQYSGKGKQANDGARYLGPALSGTAGLAEELAGDTALLQDFLIRSADVVQALGSRRADLASLVSTTAATADAIGDENVALGQALSLLPGTLRRADSTFGELRATLDDLDVLVAASKPATKDLAPFLRALRPVVAAARPTIRDLRLLVARQGKGNDLTELLRKQPRLAQAASPAFSSGTQALRDATPVLSFIRPYTTDLVGWLRDFGQSAANYDANGHFARVHPLFNQFQAVDAGDTVLLNTLAPSGRYDGYRTGQLRRCPGAAQPTADGSAPYAEAGLDCDPAQVLP
jgi:phospholipid/cholesterol/gamma-HCH transport system substrate-binding protein